MQCRSLKATQTDRPLVANQTSRLLVANQTGRLFVATQTDRLLVATQTGTTCTEDPQIMRPAPPAISVYLAGTVLGRAPMSGTTTSGPLAGSILKSKS